MRALRGDVSHRIRRRRPSIFSARWFRLVLAGGVAIIGALVVGPPVAGWLSAPRGGQRTDPEPRPVDQAAPVRQTNGVTGMVTGPVTGRDGQTPPVPATNGGAAAATASRPAGAPPPGQSAVVFRLQVGAFLDHRNADRLVERLRGEGTEVVDRAVEHGRVLHRVVATAREGESYDVLLQRLTELGFTPELSGDAVTVTAPIPLHEAVHASRRLREAGVQVRLEKTVGAAAFRVVRVGRFATADEAERARVDLAARGIDGFVVREP
jgi:cell division septation protein DedD